MLNKTKTFSLYFLMLILIVFLASCGFSHNLTLNSGSLINKNAISNYDDIDSKAVLNWIKECQLSNQKGNHGYYEHVQINAHGKSLFFYYQQNLANQVNSSYHLDHYDIDNKNDLISIYINSKSIKNKNSAEKDFLFYINIPLEHQLPSHSKLFIDNKPVPILGY